MGYSTCQTKKHFDSEYEAQRGAAIAEFDIGQEMTWYKCTPIPHWHIAHKHKKHQTGYGRHSIFKRCYDCRQIVKRTEFVNHLREHREKTPA